MAGVAVLGGGVTAGTFVAALRRHDPDVPITLVERELVGGECSYWACIPSKTMLRPYEIVWRAKAAPGADAALSGQVDPAAVFAWRDEVSAKDDTSQAKWLDGLGVELVRGSAEILEPGHLRVGSRELEYDRLLVATGSVSAAPPIPGLEDVRAWTSREGTSATAVPERLAIVGGGAVGCELAQFYARAGSRVTIVQNGERLLPRAEAEAADLLGEVFLEEGIELVLGATAESVESGDGKTVRLHVAGRTLEADALLVATGRRPNVEGLGLERLDVKLGRAGIEVDDRLRAAENVWAAGDVTGVALFTHVGKYQARVAAANMTGEDVRADYRAIPAAVFTDPQVATVGDVSGEGGVVVGRRGIDEVSRASTYARPKRRGFVKLYADPKKGVLVGAVAVGPEAGEWLGQLTLAVRAAVPVDVLVDTIQPFPTFSEAIYFAARDLGLDAGTPSA